MAKKKGKKGKSKKNKKKKNKLNVADMVADVVANLARKSTKKLLKSFGKKAGNLVPQVNPANLLAAALENTGNKEIKDNSNNNEVKQGIAALTDADEK
ncbi:hypothetical protein HUW51_12720 [Adhaeribacter swui]|uniref:Uncharacterized protein n=1 Tax=Adhaeribacter swui TaxID=2086471 RepID=A0A7G7G8Q8_9BACT|nr:hypothetical protein [Adhaeribacter swui]QNF33542.1 hypothetical protein HUW51_12720 [Adhaeribacter swui]